MLLRPLAICTPLVLAATVFASGDGKYIEVPLSGTFGREINADGVSRCLDFAKRRGANTIVFVIDSPGGTVRDAEAISAVLRASDADFRYAAVVRRAISASVWVLANCDTIGFLPGSASGAAVVFSHDQADTGAVEVDAKINSATAATLASLADAKGQPGAVYRAMMVLDESLFAVPQETGFTLTNIEPESAPAGMAVLDGPGTILTLTAADATRYGFGRSVTSAADPTLGAALGFDSWTRVDTPQSAPNILKSAREAAERAREAIRKAEAGLADTLGARDRLVAELPELVKAAEKESPQTVVRVYADPYTGIMSQSSQRRWQQQTDLCIREWRKVHAALTEIRALQDRIVRATEQVNRERSRLHTLCRWVDTFQPAEPPAFTDQGELDGQWKLAQAEIAALQARRNRTRADQ